MRSDRVCVHHTSAILCRTRWVFIAVAHFFVPMALSLEFQAINTSFSASYFQVLCFYTLVKDTFTRAAVISKEKRMQGLTSPLSYALYLLSRESSLILYGRKQFCHALWPRGMRTLGTPSCFWDHVCMRKSWLYLLQSSSPDALKWRIIAYGIGPVATNYST
jgi:hypothetical protein